MSDEIIRRELSKIADRVAWLTSEMHRAESIRDALVRELADNDGAHDRRPGGVR